MRGAWALCVLLGGCGTLLQPSYSLYTPERPSGSAAPTNIQFELDRSRCEQIAEAYVTPTDPWALLLAGGSGAASQPQDPVSAMIGGVAGLANGGLSQIGANPADRRFVFRLCVDRLTQADQSAGVLGVLDPR